MGMIAVIDTETNWYDQVMSIGAVIAGDRTLEPVEARYYVLEPEIYVGGMYDGVLDPGRGQPVFRGCRSRVLEDLAAWLRAGEVEGIYAYNARFDCQHLAELGEFAWYDIMRLAAYRQYNHAIPEDAPCCSTGRLKRCYGVEPITRMLTGDGSYREIHNALWDAVDELAIMRLLGQPIRAYACARIR